MLRSQVETFVFFSPRLSTDVGAHFLPFFSNVISESTSRYRRVIVVIPQTFEMSSKLQNRLYKHGVETLVVHSKWPWGNDIGLVNPLSISRLILNKIEPNNLGRVHLFANESSLAILLAMCCVMLLRKSITSTVNLLDYGFWNRLINAKGLTKIVWKSLLSLLRRLNPKLHIVAQSPELVTNLNAQGLLEVKLWPFGQVTHKKVFTKLFKSEKLGKGKKKRTTILILPWPEDLETVIEVVRMLVKQSDRLLFNIHIHLKSEKELEEYFSLLSSHRNLKISAGSLQTRDYWSMMINSNLVWLPYSSKYHSESGSGRVVDALAAGVPVILDKKSVMHRTHGSLVGKFLIPVHADNPGMIRRKILRTLTVGGFNHDREYISEIVTTTFSANSMMSYFESEMKLAGNYEKSNRLVTIGYFLINCFFHLCMSFHARVNMYLGRQDK